jgi:TIR domain/Pentapeptide repeats (8 copies)
MPNDKHLKVLKKGVATWNAWRLEDPDTTPDLAGADLDHSKLSGANFCRTILERANLRFADLRGANLGGANLNEAMLYHSILNKTDLTSAHLGGSDLSEANLTAANLSGANLRLANLSAAKLSATDFRQARIGWTIFAENDLSAAIGLEDVIHTGPSTIGLDTLFKSRGRIPEAFLRGAGVPEDFITFVPSLVGRPLEFYSSFISHSHLDGEFARRLHSRMRDEKLRVWYAPEDMQGGKKLHEEIFRAIQIHDKLLLVLSEHSMKSEWVMTEIRRARKVEREENRRKLFPIRLVDFDTIQKWECFDADSGKDLAVELREYYIPDFSNWKNHDVFEVEFAKLLRDLRATEK